jgi:transcriptional regulator GlxA family with amidase domain
MHEQPSPILFARCRKAMEYMDAHLKETITLADLGIAASTSPRRLEGAFQLCVGKTPMLVLRRKRMEKIRQALLTMDGTINVKVLRCKYGFFHGGDFAKYYSDEFGEKPSATRSHARATRGLEEK